MDPVTQGVVGAALPLATHNHRRFLWAGFCGLMGGLAPDLDNLIRSDHDPLLYLEYHRHFTHSLIFIPLGGLLVASFLHFIIGRWKDIPFKQTYLFATLGYATHGLIDAMTSYGTMLFWPFSDMRVAFNYISIIDPIFSAPIAILVFLSLWRRQAIYGLAALFWGTCYLCFGAFQYVSAVDMGREIAKDRGHSPTQLSAKPSFGNSLLWKVIYRHEDRYFVDAVRPNFRQKFFQGTSIAALDLDRDFPWLDKNSQQAKDIERFHWFSKGYVAKDPKRENGIIDLRYSFLPNEIDGLWSLGLSKTADMTSHGEFRTHRRATPERQDALWDMITAD